MTGKTGAARVALTTRCPVIPVAQWGPQEIQAPYAKELHLFPRKTMRMIAGPPVDLSDLYDRPLNAATLREATNRILAAITSQLETIRGEKAPATRFDSRTAGVAETGNPQQAPSHQVRGSDEWRVFMTRVAVFGTGSWGTAFAAVLADAGSQVRMWGRRAELVDEINQSHVNR